MGICKSVSIKELLKGNKRMCLSALRVFGRCDECEIMRRYYQDQTRIKPKGVKPCEDAVFNEERLKYLKKEREIKSKIHILEDELKNLKGGFKK